jgi:spermidine synthase
VSGSGLDRLSWLLYPLFFASGASSLIFENLWQRKMTHVFGASAPSITVILTAFFFGMALGSWWGGRLLDRYQHRIPTLRFYALTELWIGVFGVSVPFLLSGVDPLYVALFSTADLPPLFSVAYRFAMCSAVALPASLGMGATIPVMSRLLSEYGFGVGRSVSLAYGVNTVGAVLGCLATGFVLLPALGIQGSLFFASAGNAAVIVAASALSAISRPAVMDTPLPAASQSARPKRRRLIALYVAAGFLAIGFEVEWMRMIAIFTTNGLTTFTLGLSVYLTGFSFGSLVVYPLLERRLSGLAIFLVSNLGTALTCLVLLANAQGITNAVWTAVGASIQPDSATVLAVTSVELANIAALILLPTIFMGLAFPAVCQTMTESRDRIAVDSGFLYFAGNVGSTAGAFVTGLLLVPALGLDGTWGVLVAASAALALATLSLAELEFARGLRVVAVATAAVALFIGSEERPYLHYGEGRIVKEGDAWRFVDDEGRPRPVLIVRNETGQSATVTVRESRYANPFQLPERRIYIDDQAVASSGKYSLVDQKMLAHLPLLLHPHPETALTVGFGSGGTSYSMTTHGVRTDVVEIEPEVVRSANLFDMQNRGVLRSPLLEVVLDDARNHLYVTRKRYDVISSDVTNLQYKQNGSLYTREFFQLCADRLTPGGVMASWIPLGLFDDEFATLLATFRDVFPHATLWFFDEMPTTFALLIGTQGELEMDYERIRRGFEIPAVREDLARILIFHPLQLVYFLYLDEDGYDVIARGAPLHTDDHPILEFRSQASYYPAPRRYAEQLARLWSLKPRSVASRIRNLPPSEREDLHRYERLARAWGGFWVSEQLGALISGNEAGLRRWQLERLQEAAEAVPEYAPASRRLRYFRKVHGFDEQAPGPPGG